MKLKNLALTLALSSPAAFASSAFMFCSNSDSTLSLDFFDNEALDNGSLMGVDVVVTKNGQYRGKLSGVGQRLGQSLAFYLNPSLNFSISFNGEVAIYEGTKYLVGTSTIGSTDYTCFAQLPSGQ